MASRPLHSWLSVAGGVALCTLFRLLPYRPPNVEPVMSTVMPMGKRFGPLHGFVMAFLSMSLYDVLSGQYGSWTLINAGVYGAIGAGSAAFLGPDSGVLRYVAYAIVGTLVFDAITGVLTGVLLFDVPFRVALTGQIPFTINHLLGNVILAAVWSPLLERVLRAYAEAPEAQAAPSVGR